MTERMDKERLGAFVDDELTPEEAAAVVVHLADCPEDRAWVERVTVDRARVARAFADIADDPVPPALAALLGIEGPPAPAADRVIAPPPGFWRRRGPAALAGLAAAAGVALAIGVGLVRAPGPAAPAALEVGPATPGSPLAAALDALPSGAERAFGDGTTLRLAASFPDARGNLCREFYVAPDAGGGFAHAVACTAGEGWSVEIVAAEDPAPGDGGADDRFLPAEGPGARAVERLLDEIGAGLALDAAAEEAARARGWRP